MTLASLAGVALLAVVCGLDRTAAWQTFLHRPLPAAVLAGWILGEPRIGLETGVMLELLWLARLPVGAAIPPDDTQMALAATVLAVAALAQWPAPLAVAFGVLWSLLLGGVGMALERWGRKRNDALVPAAREAVARGDAPAVETLHLRGAVHFAQVSILTLLVIVLPGWLALVLLRTLPAPPLAVARGLLLILPLIGLGAVLSQSRTRTGWSLFLAGFGLAWLVGRLAP